MNEQEIQHTHEVFSRIRSAFGSMSKAEKKIATFFMENTNTVRFLTITDLALEVGTSESTIVRFSRKLGFNGFPEFKKALFAEILTEPPEGRKLTYERLIESDSIDDVRRKLFELMRTTIDDTLHNLIPSSFEEATKKIAYADRLNIFASNESGHIAHTSAQKFLLLGINVSIHTEPTLYKLYAHLQKEHEVNIVLSHSGTPELLIEVLNIAKRRGAFVIGITSNVCSPIAQQADIHLLTSMPMESVGDEAGVIRISQIAVMDCLALAVAHYRKQMRLSR